MIGLSHTRTHSVVRVGAAQSAPIFTTSNLAMVLGGVAGGAAFAFGKPVVASGLILAGLFTGSLLESKNG